MGRKRWVSTRICREASFPAREPVYSGRGKGKHGQSF